MPSDLHIFLTIVKTYTEKGMSLHRAKALKWTGERIVDECRGLNKQDRVALWQHVLERKLVNLDQNRNIHSLSDSGEAVLSQSDPESV